MNPIMYKQLAATGKYYNTGKVLIGVAYQPKPRRLNYDERVIQNVLLEPERPWYYKLLMAAERILP